MLYNYHTCRPAILIPLFSILLSACQGKPAGEAAPATAAKLPVDVIIARDQVLDQQEIFVGTIIPQREVVIVSETAQRITRIAFTDGSYVQQGAVLYTLDDTGIQSRLRQVLAELKLARLNKDRMARLLETETVKQQEYDEALAQLGALEAQQDYLRTELDKTIIRAPFAGKAGISKVHQGAYVSTGMPLVMLQDQHNPKISFTLPERYLPLIATGTTVTFSTSLSEERYTASISATEPGLDAQDRSLRVQALTHSGKEIFHAGQSVKVYFNTEKKGATGITIPTEALVPGGQGYNAFIIKNSIAQPVPVTIANRTETEAIIASGLNAGDSIVVSNILRITGGTPVQAIVNK